MNKFWDKTAPKGNVLLRFQNFSIPETNDATTGAILIYYISVYHLYPKKVFAVPPGTLVNTPEDLLTHPFNPPAEWIRKHNVDTKVTFAKDKNGNIRTFLDRYRQVTSK